VGESLGRAFSWGTGAASTVGGLVAGTDALESDVAIVGDGVDILSVRPVLNCLD
jgi:hypothetical protein